MVKWGIHILFFDELEVAEFCRKKNPTTWSGIGSTQHKSLLNHLVKTVALQVFVFFRWSTPTSSSTEWCTRTLLGATWAKLSPVKQSTPTWPALPRPKSKSSWTVSQSLAAHKQLQRGLTESILSAAPNLKLSFPYVATTYVMFPVWKVLACYLHAWMSIP